MVAAVSRPSGVQRCLRPLPSQRTWARRDTSIAYNDVRTTKSGAMSTCPRSSSSLIGYAAEAATTNNAKPTGTRFAVVDARLQSREARRDRGEYHEECFNHAGRVSMHASWRLPPDAFRNRRQTDRHAEIQVFRSGLLDQRQIRIGVLP